MALAFSTSIFPCNSSSSTEFRDSSFRFPLSFHGSRSSIVFSDSKASTVPLRAARELRRRRCAGEKNSSQNSSAGEISPLLPSSCRYVPTCSEYSMAAYKKYGVIKGTILTAWRLCRCNPLGGSGFDPPRWFDEPRAPLE
ncbi:uncharacterized protein LOC116254584 isoform X4 [Nymphaea colorata]|uniref:uncharacterized protein LOC116254584 isoform X4 n=1 Tax=Nymphaea colorata TaxID=210225 RepID=UPI00129DAD88|nr:uncharacterized protein LOC116254584 isoform X4 [Nymphaea colorata]